MKVRNLKNKIEQKIYLLPEEKRRISSVKEEFKNHLISSIQKQTIIMEPFVEIDNKDLNVNSYKKTNEISSLDTSSFKALQACEEIIKSEDSPLDKLKIIGITGSIGKSTTAYIIHEYLKSLGYKSVLYSSICVDSPASYVKKDEACDIPLYSESVLLDMIEEAEAYGADYLVIEVNESAIAKGLSKDIPFVVRALTNIIPDHNNEQYLPDEYVRLKKSFFENIPLDEECTCVFGLTHATTREEFNSLLRLNNNPKITYGSKYICEVRNADYTNLDCLLYGMESNINGLEMKIRVKDKSYDFKTSLILQHNALNFTCAIAIAEALNVFDGEKFSHCIENIFVPGREEVIKRGDRTIVIGLFLAPALENFKNYQNNEEVNKIKVVVGAIGTGYVNWSKEFSSDLFISKRSSARKFAMDYLKQYANYAYITSNDNAAEDPYKISLELQGYIGGQVPSQIVVDREEAIRKAILESHPRDIIYIAGRGNKRVLCDSKDTVKIIKDKDVVLRVLEELGW